MESQQNLIGAIIVAFIAAAVPGFWALWQSRDKQRLDERSRYYSDIRDDVDELRDRLDLLEGYVGDLEGHIDELNRIMVAAGLQPPPRPKRPSRPRPGAA